jgi:peptidoglycan/xylan/chitin deacetylase (PgdA/CDA1 family)
VDHTRAPHVFGGPPRDFVGYGRRPPVAPWPNGAQIAVSLVLNYEEGSEQSVLDGDRHGESLAEVAREPRAGERDLAIESMYEYGSRVGVWRLFDLFERQETPVTVYACAVAVERNPEVAEYLRESPHEVLAHGYRWEDVTQLGETVEREHIRLAVTSLEKTVGRRPRGWYCRYGPSVHTRRLVVEEGGFEYDCDSYADDLPYFVDVSGQPWCVVPHALDSNDLKFWRGPGFGPADELFAYLRDSFDTLYREGATTPKMLTVSLHCRVAGRPGRTVAVERFIAYAKHHPRVWFARRLEIARAWRAAFQGPA